MEQFESNRTSLKNGELFPKKNQQDFHTSSVRCSMQSQIIELVSITTLSSIVLFSQLIINHHVFASKINHIEVVLIFLFFSFFNLLFHPSLHQSHRRTPLSRCCCRKLSPQHYHSSLQYRFSHLFLQFFQLI